MRVWDALTGRLPRLREERNVDEANPLLDRHFLAQIESLRIAGLGAILAGLSGEHVGRSRTQAIEFADYRGYAPGDDFRQIDWNAYSRLGELFVKSSVAEENLILSLLIDRSRSMDWGTPNKLRYARRLAAALGAVALLHYDEVRVYALGDGEAVAGTPLRGHEGLPLLVRELEALSVAGSTDLLPAVEAFRGMGEPQGITVLLSDLMVPPAAERVLAYLGGGRTRATLLHILAPQEVDPPLGGPFELRDSETGAIAEITITPGVRQRYLDRFTSWSQAIEALSAAEDVRYIRATTDVPPADLLLGLIRQEGVISVR